MKKYVTPGRDGTPPVMKRRLWLAEACKWTNVDRPGPAPTPESPAHGLAVLEKLDATKRKEEERRMNRKPSLREKLKKLVKGSNRRRWHSDRPTVHRFFGRL